MRRRRRRRRGTDRDRHPAAPRRAGGRCRAAARRKFGLVMRTADVEGALAVAQTTREAVSRAIWVDQVVQVGANRPCGCAARRHDREELMRRADLALRAAKRRGRGSYGSSPTDMEADFDERRFIKRELSRALAARALEIHYQPIVTRTAARSSGSKRCCAGTIRTAATSRRRVRAGRRGGRADGSSANSCCAARWPTRSAGRASMSRSICRRCRCATAVRRSGRGRCSRRPRSIPPRVVLEITEGVLIDDPMTPRRGSRNCARSACSSRSTISAPAIRASSYLQQLPVRQAQDRPRLRRRARPVGERRRDHPGDRGARTRARHERAGRGGGDRGAARAAAARRLQRDAGLSVREAGAADEIDRLVAAGEPQPARRDKAADA